MSDYYKQAGDLKRARELLEKALAISPNSKQLHLMQAELDNADKRSVRGKASRSEADSKALE